MDDNVARIACILVQLAALIFVFLRTVRLIQRNRNAMPVVLFAFAITTFLVSDLYWLTFILMRHGTRLPFTPSEIADDGVLMFFGSAMIAMYRGRRERMAGLIIASALFSAANIALWIGWSGEWVKDIIGAFPFAYLVYGCTRSLKLSGAFSRRDWTLLGAGSVVLIASQTAVFFCPAPLARIMDAFCYMLLFAGIVWFAAKLARAWRRPEEERCTALAFSANAWCLCALYMSADPIWYIVDLLTTAMLFFMLFALEKHTALRQVTAA